jgi:hypothetical protein
MAPQTLFLDVRLNPDIFLSHKGNKSFMKAKYLLALCFSLAAMPVIAQTDSTGLPGDNFSLEAALDLFKNSASPEAFEKALNTEGNNVNNLDLNDDGDIDYIRVIDHRDGDVHTIVLQATISATESQDVAVIELEKTARTPPLSRSLATKICMVKKKSWSPKTMASQLPSVQAVRAMRTDLR